MQHPRFDEVAMAAVKQWSPHGVQMMLGLAFLTGWLDVRPDDWPDRVDVCWRAFSRFWERTSVERFPGVESAWRQARETGRQAASQDVKVRDAMG